MVESDTRTMLREVRIIRQLPPVVSAVAAMVTFTF